MVGSTSAPSSGATPLKKLLMMVMAAALCLGLAPVAPASAAEPAAEKQTVTEELGANDPQPGKGEASSQKEDAKNASAKAPAAQLQAASAAVDAQPMTQLRTKAAPSAVTVAPTVVDGKLSIPDPLPAAKFSVALTVVDATDGNKVVYNGAVENMAPGSTVLDMLKAAGFTEVADLAETAGNDRAFCLTYDSPYFLGKGYDPATGAFWTTMADGSSDNHDDAMAPSPLKAGGSYQYVYGTETAFAYGVQGVAAPDPKPDDSAYATCKYDAAKAASLQQNLAARFSRGGAEAAIDNTTAFAAITLNDLGLGASIDGSAILASLADYEKANGAPIRAGALAKYILALTAAGVDCTRAPMGGATHNLVAEMEALISEDAMSVYDAVMILPVYGDAGYEQGSCAMSVQDLVDYLVASQQDNGLFTVSSPDSQTASQAILALIPYRSQPAVSKVIDKTVATVRAMQLPDGSFAYNPGDTQGNLDATANVVVALAALGVDPLSLVTDNGSSPLGFAIALADDELAGYARALDEDLIGNETMASATVLLALAANQGYQKAGGAYDAYDLTAVTPPAQGEPGDEGAAKAPAAGTALVPTGDDGLGAAGAVAALALSAAACMAVARRREAA